MEPESMDTTPSLLPHPLPSQIQSPTEECGIIKSPLLNIDNANGMENDEVIRPLEIISVVSLNELSPTELMNTDDDNCEPVENKTQPLQIFMSRENSSSKALTHVGNSSDGKFSAVITVTASDGPIVTETTSPAISQTSVPVDDNCDLKCNDPKETGVKNYQDPELPNAALKTNANSKETCANSQNVEMPDLDATFPVKDTANSCVLVLQEPQAGTICREMCDTKNLENGEMSETVTHALTEIKTVQLLADSDIIIHRKNGIGIACDVRGSLLALATKLRKAEYKIHKRTTNPSPPPAGASLRAGLSKLVEGGTERFRFIVPPGPAVKREKRALEKHEDAEDVEEGKVKRIKEDNANPLALEQISLTIPAPDPATEEPDPEVEQSLLRGVSTLKQIARAMRQSTVERSARISNFRAVAGPLLWPTLASAKVLDDAELCAYHDRYAMDFKKQAQHYRGHALRYSALPEDRQIASMIATAVSHAVHSHRAVLENSARAAVRRMNIASACAALIPTKERGVREAAGGVQGVVDDELARKFTCDRCPYRTDNKSHLIRHKNAIHVTHRPFACYVCLKPFSRTENVRTHFRSAHPLSTYRPELVKKIRPEDFEVSPRHPPTSRGIAGKSTGNGRDSPSVNGEQSMTGDSNASTPTRDGGVVREYQDVKRTSDLYGKEQGLQDATMKRGHKSALNNNGTSSPNALSPYTNGHRDTTADETNNLPYRCELCPSRFANASFLELHCVTAHLRRLSACKWCSFCTVNSREFREHVISSHSTASGVRHSDRKQADGHEVNEHGARSGKNWDVTGISDRGSKLGDRSGFENQGQERSMKAYFNAGSDGRNENLKSNARRELQSADTRAAAMMYGGKTSVDGRNIAQGTTGGVVRAKISNIPIVEDNAGRNGKMPLDLSSDSNKNKNRSSNDDSPSSAKGTIFEGGQSAQRALGILAAAANNSLQGGIFPGVLFQNIGNIQSAKSSENFPSSQSGGLSIGNFTVANFQSMIQNNSNFLNAGNFPNSANLSSLHQNSSCPASSNSAFQQFVFSNWAAGNNAGILPTGGQPRNLSDLSDRSGPILVKPSKPADGTQYTQFPGVPTSSQAKSVSSRLASNAVISAVPNQPVEQTVLSSSHPGTPVRPQDGKTLGGKALNLSSSSATPLCVPTAVFKNTAHATSTFIPPSELEQGATPQTDQSPAARTPKAEKPRPVPRSSKQFYCALCPDREPFKYRKSFDKHMLQHSSGGGGSSGHRQTILAAPPKVATSGGAVTLLGRTILPAPPSGGRSGGYSVGTRSAGFGGGQGVGAGYFSESDEDSEDYCDDPRDKNYK